jgi:uncharacterized repeat protein (TIGR02543 family)
MRKSREIVPRTSIQKLGLDLEIRGKFKNSDRGTFAEGSSVTVIATANSGHTFVHWTRNGAVVSTSPSYTLTMPSASITLTAHFK